MSNTTTELQRDRENFRESVIRLQAEAKSEFERKTETIQDEISELDEDEIDQFVHEKFNNLNTLFLKRSNELREYVIKKKPKKPIKNSNEKDDEFKRRQKAYEESLGSYKQFVVWSSSIIERLTSWLSELFDDIIKFFKKLILINKELERIKTDITILITNSTNKIIF